MRGPEMPIVTNDLLHKTLTTVALPRKKSRALQVLKCDLNPEARSQSSLLLHLPGGVVAQQSPLANRPPESSDDKTGLTSRGVLTTGMPVNKRKPARQKPKGGKAQKETPKEVAEAEDEAMDMSMRDTSMRMSGSMPLSSPRKMTTGPSLPMA